jgi:hypothetical protein
MGNSNKIGYSRLIEQDIEELNKAMGEHSLERKHIVDVLKWSINILYPIDYCKCVNPDWCMEDNKCGECNKEIKAK